MVTINGESHVNLHDEVDLIDERGVQKDASEGIVEDDKNKDGDEECYKSITQLTSDEIWGLEFDSELEACQFYDTYAKYHGFVMRKDELTRDFTGRIVMRQLVCNREGLRHKKHFTREDRKRDHRPITRTKCPAKIRVHLDFKTLKWKVVGFEESHNHELTPAKFIHLIPAYRRMTDADKAQVESMRSYGVKTCHIMGFMLGQKGGYDELGFCKKDLYNHLDRSRRAKVEDGDAFAALSYLEGKADNDPMMYAKYTTTEDGKLQHLFWADGCSRIDFQCFGDVVAFDSTYKKNKYNQPLVIFSGCNHHGDTIIFGCALVADEKIETYKWVLETFLEAMFNKHPNSVVTDGDGAMREAIKIVFPNATHRLCAWHLQNNACENIKNPKFLEDFKTSIYSNFTEEQFEEFWKNMMEKHELSHNKWIEKIYEIKGMWAAAYLRDKFFGGIRTTSQCEGINSFIKRYVERKNSLVEFISNFERALKEYRHNELIQDFKSMYSEPVMTTPLYEIEVEASKIFTRKMFNEVKKEILGIGTLIVIERLEMGNLKKFKMNLYGGPMSEYEVLYDMDECKFMCDCRLFESRGIPCCHIFCAIKHEQMTTIPGNLICKRWTKDAKKDYLSLIASEQSDNSEKITTLRFSALSAACNRLCHLAARNADDFNQIRNEIYKLTMKLEKWVGNESTSTKVVGDPMVVKTKGAPSKKKYRKRIRCSHCRRTGHNSRRCPHLLMKDVDINDNSSCSQSEEGSIGDADDDFSLDDRVTLQNDSVERPSCGDKPMEVKGKRSSKRKHEKAINSTQSSVKKQQQKIHVPRKAPSNSKLNQQSTMNDNMVTHANFNIPSTGVTNSSGFLPPTQGMQVFPPYAGVVVYPQIPLYPPNPSLGFYPQYVGGFQNTVGANTWNVIPPPDPRIKR